MSSQPPSNLNPEERRDRQAGDKPALKFFELVRPDINIDFVGKSRFFGTLSLILVILSIAISMWPGLNYGIDFVGGYEVHVKLPPTLDESELRDLIQPLTKGEVRIQRFGDEADHEQLIFVRGDSALDDQRRLELEAAFVQLAGGAEQLLRWTVDESGHHIAATFARPVTEADVRQLLTQQDLQVKRLSAGERSDRSEFVIDLVSLAEKIQGVLTAAVGSAAGELPVRRVEFVGPQVGQELRTQGLLAVVYAMALILLYVAVRFDLFFAPGAVLALVHDLAITLGVFAVFQIEFDLQAIAALLTLAGYSLNDTIVVYDRVRENLVRLRGRELRPLVNASLNQTLGRTLLTGVPTLFVVGSLLVFGGETLRSFSIALLVGIVVGTYSSIWIASPIYILLRERGERHVALRKPGATVAQAE